MSDRVSLASMKDDSHMRPCIAFDISYCLAPTWSGGQAHTVTGRRPSVYAVDREAAIRALQAEMPDAHGFVVNRVENVKVGKAVKVHT